MAEGIKYVVHGMKAECSEGTMQNYINADVGHGVLYQGQPLLNANDHEPQKNLTHFGDCNSRKISARRISSISLPRPCWLMG